MAASERQILHETVAAMTLPTVEQRAQATAAGGSQDAHDRFMADWPCMNTLELRQPAPAAPGPELRIAAWNIERCKRVEDSAALIRQSGADIVLATEVDWGCARSGQRHTTRDLADLLGMGYVFGTEFVELGLGDPFETETCAGKTNDHGLHGNAILSRFPLENVALIPLDDGGLWFATSPKGDGQYRVGGRNAITARVETPDGPLTLAAAHYESESDPALRAAQTHRLLIGLAQIHGDTACIVGGDLNTKEFIGLKGREILADPGQREPTFTAFAEAGLDWQDANTTAFTTRAAPGRPVRYPLLKLDWLCTRGATARDPFQLAAVSEDGEYLSDHELIGATFRIGASA